jgi:hypothetical protein
MAVPQESGQTLLDGCPNRSCRRTSHGAGPGQFHLVRPPGVPPDCGKVESDPLSPLLLRERGWDEGSRQSRSGALQLLRSSAPLRSDPSPFLKNNCFPCGSGAGKTPAPAKNQRGTPPPAEPSGTNRADDGRIARRLCRPPRVTDDHQSRPESRGRVEHAVTSDAAISSVPASACARLHECSASMPGNR